MNYFQDRLSKVVLKVDFEYDIKEMKKHPDYQEVTEKEYDEYLKKTKQKRQE